MIDVVKETESLFLVTISETPIVRQSGRMYDQAPPNT
jgi:hypothetical protein